MGKKQKGSASVYILAVYVIVLLILLWLYTFQARLINAVRDTYDSGLLLSLLGAATIDVGEYGSTGQRVVSPEAALQEFKSLFAANLELSADGQGTQAVVAGPVTIAEFRVFNVEETVTEAGSVEKQVREHVWQNGGWGEISHAVNEQVYTAGAGGRGHGAALVEDTGLYARITFTISLYPYFPGLAEHVPEAAKTKTVSMQRYVSIPKT